MTILPLGGPSSIVKTRLPSHFARSGHIIEDCIIHYIPSHPHPTRLDYFVPGVCIICRYPQTLLLPHLGIGYKYNVYGPFVACLEAVLALVYRLISRYK